MIKTSSTAHPDAQAPLSLEWKTTCKFGTPAYSERSTVSMTHSGLGSKVTTSVKLTPSVLTMTCAVCPYAPS